MKVIEQVLQRKKTKKIRKQKVIKEIES